MIKQKLLVVNKNSGTLETILIIDFGSQFTQLIARRVRELNVYCEIHAYDNFPVLSPDIKGVILSGSHFSVRDPGSPDPGMNFKGKIPVLGICYGAQFSGQKFGGEVQASNNREYGRARLSYVNDRNKLFRFILPDTQVWMSHSDTIANVPDSFEVLASTDDVKVAGFKLNGEDTYGLQFHPEVFHTTQGSQLLKNFVVDICGCFPKMDSGFIC